jgi:hypothetical protein
MLLHPYRSRKSAPIRDAIENERQINLRFGVGYGERSGACRLARAIQSRRQGRGGTELLISLYKMNNDQTLDE